MPVSAYTGHTLSPLSFQNVSLRKLRHAFTLALLAAVSLASFTFAESQRRAVSGVFRGSSDIGAAPKGSTRFEPGSGVYRVTGGGADMWGAADAFHFSWVRLSGDASLSADVQFPGTGVVPLEKAVLIFRQSLDSASPYADVAIHGDGHITLQYRKLQAGPTADITAPSGHQARLQIVRKGNEFTAYAGPNERELTPVATATVALTGPVYVGIGVCAHNAGGLAAVTFSDVKLERKLAKSD